MEIGRRPRQNFEYSSIKRFSRQLSRCLTVSTPLLPLHPPSVQLTALPGENDNLVSDHFASRHVRVSRTSPPSCTWRNRVTFPRSLVLVLPPGCAGLASFSATLWCRYNVKTSYVTTDSERAMPFHLPSASTIENASLRSTKNSLSDSSCCDQLYS